MRLPNADNLGHERSDHHDSSHLSLAALLQLANVPMADVRARYQRDLALYACVPREGATVQVVGGRVSIAGLERLANGGGACARLLESLVAAERHEWVQPVR